jgi:hypothetical protein
LTAWLAFGRTHIVGGIPMTTWLYYALTIGGIALLVLGCTPY